MATSWIPEDDALADLRNRLQSVRGQMRSFNEEEEEDVKLDTLKILESKFGSPVYDPTSPMQIAYDRRCARSGRRRSIEFEDLCLASGRLLLHSGRQGHGCTPTTSDPHQPTQTGPAKQRYRKISDPTVPNRRKLLAAGHHGKVEGDDQGDHAHAHEDVGHVSRGILGMTLGKEERQRIDARLAGISDPSELETERHSVSRRHKAK